ncbi:OSTA-like protein [Mya arenaria]|uniref:OSTA-like protein n=1 Tax=Mya arenaria TaxID=6604 RepID=A0ABY7FNF8_MYAAR|nr:OSTA-like protein [Mya arenaria]
MTNCSNEFPTTDIYYDEIGSDTGMLVCLGIAGALTLVCVGIFVEEVSFVRRHYSYQVHGNIANKMIIILALFPLHLCVYLRVRNPHHLAVRGRRKYGINVEDRRRPGLHSKPALLLLSLLLSQANHTEQASTRLLVLRLQVVLRKSLGVFKLLAMQMMIVRPFLLFIAAVLWTDGKYEEQMDPREPYVYIAILSTVSTLLSMYGLIVIYRASRTHLSHFSLVLKFVPFQAMMALDGIQMHVFNFLAYKDIPECVGQLGSRVRGTNFNNLLLVLESFLLCLLARRGYRMVPPDHIIDPMNPVQGINTAKDNTGGYQYGSLGHEDS